MFSNTTLLYIRKTQRHDLQMGVNNGGDGDGTLESRQVIVFLYCQTSFYRRNDSKWCTFLLKYDRTGIVGTFRDLYINLFGKAVKLDVPAVGRAV